MRSGKPCWTHRNKFEHTGELKAKRQKQDLDWMGTLVDEGLKARFYHHPEIRKLLSKMTDDVLRGETTPSNGCRYIALPARPLSDMSLGHMRILDLHKIGFLHG